LIKMKKIAIILLITLFYGCRSEVPNPNDPTLSAVVDSEQGLLALVVGTQVRFTTTTTSGLYTGIVGSGLSTRELRVVNAGNADITALEAGGTNVAPANPVVTNLWTNLNLIRFNSEQLIANAGIIPNSSLSAGVRAYGHLYKALALGTMAQFWTHIPIQSAPNANFVTRQEALQQAVLLLDQASDLLNGVTLPTTLASAVGSDVNLLNASRALSARYNLMLGNYTQAIAKANLVDMTSRSSFAYDNVNPNPIFRFSLVTNNVFDVNANFGLTGALAPNPDDKRIAFYITPQAANGKGFFRADDTRIPLYLPSEMTLIKAEALARTNQLTEAVTELNKVIAKTAASDIFGIGANLPAFDGTGKTQDEILFEIYKNRCIELYMSGMKLEDSRRFNRPGPAEPVAANRERTRNYYPFPLTERDNNINTPADPAN
jgi:starch-binding outer membrane protein, SusD/RagB family